MPPHHRTTAAGLALALSVLLPATGAEPGGYADEIGCRIRAWEILRDRRPSCGR
jgi:hypothetical protein